MPGIPLVARETISHCRYGDQPYRQDSRLQLSAEDEIAAEESLSAYCKPVELYNILQRRALRNPLFLQRCLHYKVQARHRRRIQMSVSLPRTSDNGLQMQSLCPMYVILARVLSDIPDLEHSAVYRYTKARLLTTSSTERGNVGQVKFVLPEMNKLVREAKSGTLFILFVSYAGANTSYGFETSREHLDNLSLSTSVAKSCLWGKISMESIFLSWEKFPNLNLRERVEMLSTIEMHPCVMKSCLGEVKCISFQRPDSCSHMSTFQHAQVIISAEEQGAKERSPYSPCTYNSIPGSSSHVLGLRTGNVIFNYRYYQNKLQRTEVTEDFSCAFCLVKCASFKGLKLHLVSCHDLFTFEFWEYQAVNVSVKVDPRRLETIADGVDFKQLIFFLCFKKPNRRNTKLLVDKAKLAQPQTITSDVAAAASDLLNKADDAYSSLYHTHSQTRSSTKRRLLAMASSTRINLDGNPIKPITICMIGAGGFIGSHLCEKLMNETPHKVLAVDVYNDKIKHLLEPSTLPWADRIQFHRINIKHDSRLEGLIKMADLTINLAAICTPADYNTRPLDTIYSNFIDALPVVKYCSENNKRLIHFSTCEVYGKTIGCFLPKDSPLRQDPSYYVLKEDESPCIFGSIEKQRWSYACAKQLIERLVYAEGAENGLEFTIVRPFNWIGPRMDFIPGIDGPSEGVPRVLACFSNNLLRREPLKLVDGGESQRTFIYIKDAIEAVLLMIENPARANGHIFNVGNPNNEVTVRQLAEMMTKVYSKVSGESELETPTVDVSSKEFYGEGYDDSDKRIPDMTIINKQLDWNPKTSLWDLLESTLTYQHRTYAEAVKQAVSKPVAS